MGMPTPKMKLKIRRKWTAALRSRKYRKGKGGLRVDNAFCCLGVLCELYRKDTGKGEWIEALGGKSFLFETGILPTAVSTWAGLKGMDREDPLLKSKGINLSTLNDGETNNSRGLSFAKIADLIDENL